MNELAAHDYFGEAKAELGEQETHWPNLLERLDSRFKELWSGVWHEIRFPIQLPPERKILW